MSDSYQYRKAHVIWAKFFQEEIFYDVGKSKFTMLAIAQFCLGPFFPGILFLSCGIPADAKGKHLKNKKNYNHKKTVKINGISMVFLHLFLAVLTACTFWIGFPIMFIVYILVWSLFSFANMLVALSIFLTGKNEAKSYEEVMKDLGHNVATSNKV